VAERNPAITARHAEFAVEIQRAVEGFHSLYEATDFAH
jgi:hypothetical protein